MNGKNYGGPKVQNRKHNGKKENTTALVRLKPERVSTNSIMLGMSVFIWT